MICVRKKRGPREYLFLGLTAANLERLQAGQPIRLTAETHGGAVPEGWTIGIIYGQNKEEIRLEMERAGIIQPEDESTKPEEER